MPRDRNGYVETPKKTVTTTKTARLNHRVLEVS